MTEDEAYERDQEIVDAGPPVRHCSHCHESVGSQHRPSCHRQGLVTETSVYFFGKTENGGDDGLPKGIDLLANGGLYAQPPDEISQHIAKLRLLKTDWDSYGGLPPTDVALSEAEKVLRGKATLVPCSDGGVQIDWPNAEVTFRPDGSQEFDDVAHAAFKGLAARHAFVLGRETADERDRQDAQWGGPDHDDLHEREDWLTQHDLLPRFLERAHYEALDHDLSNSKEHAEKFEKNMIIIAAMCIAAVQSSRRKRG